VIDVSIAEMIVPDLHRRGTRVASRDRRPGELSDRTATWSAWRTTASVTVTDPAALPAARRLVGRRFAATEKTAARFRRDAEVHRLYRAGGRMITVSPLLAELIGAALAVAERTGGDVDPTVAAAMTAVHGPQHRDRDTSALPVCGTRATGTRAVPGWQQVDLQGRRLRVPAGSTLDLSATATSASCDRAAAAVRERLDVGVLVTLGGDAASAGPGPDGGWQVTIQDRVDRGVDLRLPAGAALATSHFTARPAGFEQDGGTPETGHLIDPHTGQAPTAIWRTASAVAFTSLEASSYTAASLIRGAGARAWLTGLGVPARLVTVHDDVITTGTWPTPFPTPRPANSRRTTH
jgi:FAD:protein FMN transferase